MLANILVKPGHIELREVETPKPGFGEVVVKIKSALTCGTDLKAFKRGHPKMPMPTLFGHEFSGDIYEAGNGVNGFKVGDQIMAVHSAPCLECHYCKIGLENLCETIMTTKALGAYAEYIKVPERIVKHTMFEKPDHLSYAESAMVEPLACVVNGIDQVEINSDDTVLIIGAGAIGLMHIMVSKILGAKRIIVSGRRNLRLKLAKELGADEVIDAAVENPVKRVMELTGKMGAELVFECTGQLSVWEESIHMVSKGGTVVLFGGCPKGTTVSFDTTRLHYDQITLKGAFHYTRVAVKKAAGYLVEKRLDVQKLITDELPFTELNKAFQLLMEGESVKFALTTL